MTTNNAATANGTGDDNAAIPNLIQVGGDLSNTRSITLKKRRGGVLRYPLEALTEHTDYLQIDIEEYVALGYMIINKKIIKIINCDNVSFSDTIQNLSKKNMLSHYKTTLRYFSITNVKNVKDVEKNLHYHQVKYLKSI